MITIALIGRPNVGKSSLFNVLTKSRKALVADYPGLTRDRHYGSFEYNNSKFLVIDTGGLEKNNSNIFNRMAEQTNIAIDECEIIFYIVDARAGRTSLDQEIAENIRKKNKQTLLIINKSEGLDDYKLISEFAKFGIKHSICISVSHREGVSQIYDYLDLLPKRNNQNIESIEKKIKISILGKPNVGKSTFINSIIGEERFIAFNEPGTTRDAISTDFIYKNNLCTLTDTAGIRKKGRVDDVAEKFSVLRSILIISQSDVAILIINAEEGLSSQDLQILGYIIEAGKPLVIAVNKWDLLDGYKKNIFKESIQKKINFFNNFHLFYISAINKIGLNKVLDGALESFKSSNIKLKTPVLNRFISDLQLTHQPAIFKGIRPKLKYIHQGGTCPPTFIIHGNHLKGLKKDYLKYLESSLIKTFKLFGTPLSIQLIESENPYDNGDSKPLKTGLVTKRRRINREKELIKKKKRI